MAVRLNRRSGTMDTEMLISESVAPMKIWTATYNYSSNTFFSAHPVPAVSTRAILWIHQVLHETQRTSSSIYNTLRWTVGGTSVSWGRYTALDWRYFSRTERAIWTSPTWKDKPLSSTSDIRFRQISTSSDRRYHVGTGTATINIGYF